MKKKVKKDNNKEIFLALQELSNERKIDIKVFTGFLETALVSSYKKEMDIRSKDKDATDTYGCEFPIIQVDVLNELETIKIYRVYKVVESVDDIIEYADFDQCITVEDALLKNPNAQVEVGGKFYEEIDLSTWSTIAIHQAKQLLLQNINAHKKEMVKSEMSNKINEIVTVTVTRRERGNVFVVFPDTNMVEGILTPRDQIQTEEYISGKKIKVLVKEVKDDFKGSLSRIEVTRSAPELIAKLMEQEIVEIARGLVTIKSIAREPGVRAKVAVTATNDCNIDVTSVCVGQNSSRISAISQELSGERIDIIKYDSNINYYIAESLSPAKIARISTNETLKAAKVVVMDDQFAKAIGKGGSNVKLASRLTGWKIDVLKNSESDLF